MDKQSQQKKDINFPAEHVDTEKNVSPKHKITRSIFSKKLQLLSASPDHPEANVAKNSTPTGPGTEPAVPSDGEDRPAQTPVDPLDTWQNTPTHVLAMPDPPPVDPLDTWQNTPTHILTMPDPSPADLPDTSQNGDIRLLPALNTSLIQRPTVTHRARGSGIHGDKQEKSAPLQNRLSHNAPQIISRYSPARHAWYIRARHQRERLFRARQRRVKRAWLSVLSTLIAILLASVCNIAFSYYQSQLPRVQSLANKQLDQSTRIYDRTGQLLYTLYDPNAGRSTPISYFQLPGVLQDAQIAAEDKTFWTNAGVDVTATARSAIVDLVARQVETGASTLTQQIIKNLSNDSDISGERKLSEAALAIGLTSEYPKWKILEMYFNIASYGAQELGVEAAVQDDFGLTPECNAHFQCIPATAFLDRDLSHCTNPQEEATCQSVPLLALARASLLAGIPQNPVQFDPLIAPGNLTALLARQGYVLNEMLKAHMSINLGLGDQVHDEGTITPEVIQEVEALSKTIQFVGFQNTLKAPHFVWWVINQLANALGNYQDINTHTGLSVPGLHLLLTGGFNIRTTLDLNLEEYVEQATVRHLDQPEKQILSGKVLTLSKDSNINDAATVVMDAQSGEILAMNGSTSWTDSDPRVIGELNGTLALRQPASTFKPIVMAAAFEAGFYPGIVLPDIRTYFPIGAPLSEPATTYNDYVPTDFGNTYSGLNPNLDFAMSNSLNIPAIKTYMFAGKASVYNMAQRLGITSIQPKQLNPTIALGTAEVSLLQMVGAYQVFANQGVRVPPHSILDIWDNYGRELYHYDPTHPDGTQVISPEIAYLTTSVLSDEPARSYEFQNDHDLSLWDWTLPDGTHPDVAAKTGTTDSFRDNWTIGFTPDLVVGVWAGNANGASSTSDSIGLTGAAPLWHSTIEYASGHCDQASDQISCPPYDLHVTDRHFRVPSGIIQQEVNTTNGLAGSGYRSWMIAGEQPQQR